MPNLTPEPIGMSTNQGPRFSFNPLDQLQSLGVNVGGLDAQVEDEIETQKANTLSIEDFNRKVSEAINSGEFNDLEEKDIYYGLKQAYKDQGILINGLDMDNLGVQEEVIPEETIVDEKGIGENITDIAKVLKIEGSEEFGKVQTAKDLGTALVNLPGDTAEGIGELVTMVSSPIDTLKSFKTLGEALSSKIVYGVLNTVFDKNVERDELHKQVTSTLSAQLEKNFGTLGKAKKTLVENPVDTLFFMKGALNTVSKVTKSSKLANIANKIDPIKLQTKPVGLITKGAKNLATSVEGKLTGLGKEGVEDIIKLGKTPEFGKAIKGEVSATTVVDDVSSAIKTMKGEAQNKFGQDLDKILKTGNIKTNITKQSDNFFTKLKDKGVLVTKDKKGNYKIKEGPHTELIEEDLAVLQNITKRINTKKGDLTGIETRSFINRMGAESSKLQNQGILLDYKKQLTDALESTSPGFKQMNTDYRKMTATVKNLEDTFGSSKVKIETKINKLNMALKDNQDYKKFMLNVIEESSGKNIKGTLAGLAAQSYLPRGLIGQIGAGGAAAALVGGSNPLVVLATLGLASPKLLGITARTLGIGVDKLNSFVNLVTKNIPKGVTDIPLTKPLATGVKGAGTVGPILDNTKE